MKRDTKIVMGVVAAIPVAILSASTFCAWAIAQGASMRWRVLFRIMCHGIPERCLYLFGVPMPICARCVGIYAGLIMSLIMGLIAFRLLPMVTEKAMRVAAFIAVTPLAIDGLTQLARLRESTNPLRLATGIAAGFAFGMWVLTAVERREESTLSIS
jgi:uncharacterized membrane protein